HLTTVLDTAEITSAPTSIVVLSSKVEASHQIMQGSSLRAIVNATRVMTPDPGSVLADHGRDTSSFIAQLALSLVQNARDQGVVFREQPKERKDLKADVGDRSGPTPIISPSDGVDATVTLTRALGVQPGALRKSRARPGS